MRLHVVGHYQARRLHVSVSQRDVIRHDGFHWNGLATDVIIVTGMLLTCSREPLMTASRQAHWFYGLSYAAMVCHYAAGYCAVSAQCRRHWQAKVAVIALSIAGCRNTITGASLVTASAIRPLSSLLRATLHCWRDIRDPRREDKSARCLPSSARRFNCREWREQPQPLIAATFIDGYII